MADLRDYDTGDYIGEATEAQVRTSAEVAQIDGGAGVLCIDDDGDVVEQPAGRRDVRRVYVE